MSEPQYDSKFVSSIIKSLYKNKLDSLNEKSVTGSGRGRKKHIDSRKSEYGQRNAETENKR